MKKILLFLAVAASLCCLLALGVSAKTVNYEGQSIELVDNLGDPEWYTGNTALAIQDKESIVILKDSEGNMTAYPSYYIFKYDVTVTDGTVTSARITWADRGGVDYSHINETAGKSYESGSIYYVELPYGITNCFSNSIFGKDAESKPEPNVVEIVIPDSVTSIDAQAFRRMNSCKKVTISKNVVSISSWAFCGSPMLETVIFKEGCVVEKIENSFSSCTALTSINLKDCTNLKVLGGGAFNGCTALRRIALPDSLEEIGSQAFYKIGELTLASDYLPKNLKKIGTHFLSGCKLQNSTLYFPEGLTVLDASYHFNDGFYCENLTLVFLGEMTTVKLDNIRLDHMTKKLTVIFAQNSFDELNGDFVQGVDWDDKKGYISKHADGSQAYSVKTDGTLTLLLQNNDPNSATELGKDANGNTVCRADNVHTTIIFCGNEEVEYCHSVRNSYTYGTWHRFFTTSWSYDLDAHNEAGTHYVTHSVINEVNCGYDGLSSTKCVICRTVSEAVLPATGNHKYTNDFDCTTDDVCDVCLLTVTAALSDHNRNEATVYTNYFEAGVYTCSCKNEGCYYSVEEETMPLFVSRGVSAKTFGTDIGLIQGYWINKNAIDEYKSGAPDFNFGILAYANVGGGAVEPKPGQDKVIDVIFDSSANDFLEVKVIGIPADCVDTAVVFCVYVKEGDKFFYLDNGNTTDTVVGHKYSQLIS